MTASVEDLFSDAPGSAYIHIVPIEVSRCGSLLEMTWRVRIGSLHNDESKVTTVHPRRADT
jgi:hypothetical protein